MELRKLTTQREREIFGECLATARATRGAGFRERGEARFGLARLTFADAYGLFEHSDDSAENVKAGFIVHDLATLPQSFPKPDLSEFRAGSVIEGSDLWSLSGGLAKTAAAGAAVVAGMMQVKTIVVYPVVSPMDLSAPYQQLHFDRPCDPVLNPYAEALDGRPLWVQPMILHGEKLEAYIRWGFQSLFGAEDHRLRVRFEGPISTHIAGTDDAATRTGEGPASTVRIPAAPKSEATNGAAAQ